MIVKLGGRSLEAPGAPRELAADIARLSRPAVLVHGGGNEVSAWCARAGVIPAFADGLRVTDAATLEVAAAVLAGLANKRLVAVLRAAGLDAVGLSAADGVVEIEPHPDAARLGFVATAKRVDSGFLQLLLAHGRTPVVSSIGALEGALWNLNADEVAGAVAAALGASDLVLLSDAPGVLIGGSIVAGGDAGDVAALLQSPEVVDGMRPKLRAARAALDAGVERAHVAAWNGAGTLSALLAGNGSGSTFRAAKERMAS